MARLESKSKKKFYDFCCLLGFVDPVMKTAYLNKISNIVHKIFKNKNVYLTDIIRLLILVRDGDTTTPRGRDVRFSKILFSVEVLLVMKVTNLLPLR